MKLIKILLIGFVIVGLAAFLSKKLAKSEPLQAKGSIYDFKSTSLDGQEIDFAQYKGKKLLIVNTASKCGKTPQYADLQKLNAYSVLIRYPGETRAETALDHD